MEWKIKDGCHIEAVNKFLSTGAPMPENCELIGRYHAPGSVNGWILLETDDLSAIYKHAAEWAEFLDWTTTPVLNDEEAGIAASQVVKTSV